MAGELWPVALKDGPILQASSGDGNAPELPDGASALRPSCGSFEPSSDSECSHVCTRKPKRSGDKLEAPSPQCPCPDSQHAQEAGDAEFLARHEFLATSFPGSVVATDSGMRHALPRPLAGRPAFRDLIPMGDPARSVERSPAWTSKVPMGYSPRTSKVSLPPKLVSMEIVTSRCIRLTLPCVRLHPKPGCSCMPPPPSPPPPPTTVGRETGFVSFCGAPRPPTSVTKDMVSSPRPGPSVQR